jgi:hypothetical protein
MSIRRAGFARKVRLLTHVIIMSVSMNCIFFVLFFYFLIRTTPFVYHFEYEQPDEEPLHAKKFSNVEVLKTLAALPHSGLVEKLKSDELVEDGYKIRDLALALLVRRDYFDLPRALGKAGVQVRWIEVGSRKLALFPSIGDEEHRKIQTFLNEERWPLTSQGLFLSLKRYPNDIALNQACTQTTEFLNVEMLFKECKVVKKKWLLTLLSEGKWDFVERFVREQKQRLDLSAERRLSFLLGCLQRGSQTAASLLLLTDFETCLKRLDDTTLVQLLDRLPSTSKRGELLSKRLLESPRGNLVQAKARKRLGLSEPVAQIRPARAAIGELRPIQRDRPTSSPPPSAKKKKS